MDFVQGDDIEHWENGIGKILKVNQSSIVVTFLNRGEIEVPIEGTKYFKKLSAEGLWARFFENQDDARKLVKEYPAETIELLIRDLDPTHGKKIERSKLKTLLTTEYLCADREHPSRKTNAF
jgi:transcription elongation factor GreA-like protein